MSLYACLIHSLLDRSLWRIWDWKLAFGVIPTFGVRFIIIISEYQTVIWVSLSLFDLKMLTVSRLSALDLFIYPHFKIRYSFKFYKLCQIIISRNIFLLPRIFDRGSLSKIRASCFVFPVWASTINTHFAVLSVVASLKTQLA